MKIKTVKINKDQPLKKTLGLIYGISGTGKTTMAATFPNAVFLSLEKNTEEFDGIQVLDFDKSYNGLKSTLEEILKTPKELGDTRYIIIDSITALDNLICQDICKRYGITDINENVKGAKRGVQHSLRKGMFENILNLFTKIVEQTDLSIVMIAHAKDVWDNNSNEPKVIGIDINLPDKYKDMLKQRVDYGLNIQNGTYKNLAGELVKAPHINFQPVGTTDSFNLIRKLGNKVLIGKDNNPIHHFDPSHDVLEQYIKLALEQ